MDGAEFGIIRRLMGFSMQALAEYFGVAKKTIMRWERGFNSIPINVEMELEAMFARFVISIDDIIGVVEDSGEPLTLKMYRFDDEYKESNPDAGKTFENHRALLDAVYLMGKLTDLEIDAKY